MNTRTAFLIGVTAMLTIQWLGWKLREIHFRREPPLTNTIYDAQLAQLVADNEALREENYRLRQERVA